MRDKALCPAPSGTSFLMGRAHVPSHRIPRIPTVQAKPLRGALRTAWTAWPLAGRSGTVRGARRGRVVRSGVAPMEQAMIGPGDEKGAVVIRTIFGEIAADERNFDRPLEELLADPEADRRAGARPDSHADEEGADDPRGNRLALGVQRFIAPGQPARAAWARFRPAPPASRVRSLIARPARKPASPRPPRPGRPAPAPPPPPGRLAPPAR